MNWKKIFVYIGIFFLATGVTAFPFGFFQGLFNIVEERQLVRLVIGQAIAILIVSIWVFSHLTINLKEKHFMQALFVGLGGWFVSFPINVLIFKQPVLDWAGGILPILFSLSIGVLIGKVIQEKKQRKIKADSVL